MRKSFVLRLDGGLFDQLKSKALERGSSMNALCAQLLGQSLGRATTEELSAPYQAFKKYFKADLRGIVLFGSEARGTQRANSDKDLLIILSGNRAINATLYRKWQGEGEPEVDPRISAHFVHLPRELSGVGSLWLEVALEGQLIYDPSGKISEVLNKLRQSIAEGKFLRKLSYGVPYWKRIS